MAGARILVVEDDADTRANLRDLLELDDYDVDEAATAAAGIDLARARGGDYLAAVLDRRLPDAAALDVLPRLRALAPDTAIIVVTGYGDIEGAVEALRHGAADYILKPLSPEALRLSLARIADRRRLAEAKRRSENAFRHLLEAAECVIVIMREDLSLVYMSPFTERLIGWSNAEARGRGALEVIRPVREPGVTEEAVRTLSAGGKVTGLQDHILCRDGSTRWMVWNACRLDDYEGAPAFLAVAQDITSLKLAQERALQSERLAAIGQMVTGLAHESRNALQRSQACLEMLALEVADRPAAQNLIRRIQLAQDHLTHLYEDVRGYAAPLRLDRKPLSLPDVWRSAWAHLGHHPQRAGATLTEALACDDPTCQGDAFRLEQVFRNILENSLAAGSPPVAIAIACEPDWVGGAPAVRVAVRDDGPGLSPEDRRRIFEPFYTTKIKGTGLGMAIARRIVEAHGGRVAVGDREPPAGRGAEIVVVLPRGNP
jgi:PAS domain S-box-containing protein